MAVKPVWQPYYVDLCDNYMIRFGLECPVCGARYATQGTPIEEARALLRAPGDLFPPLVEDAKRATLAEFHAAVEEMLTECFRCRRLACPDCWDHDNRMCGECVVNRGLARSPHRGFAGFAPLADGRLERLSPGRFSDADRPAWLKQLLLARSTGSGMSSAVAAETPVSPQAAAATPNSVVQLWMVGEVTTDELTRRVITEAPRNSVAEDMVAQAPTVRVAVPDLTVRDQRPHASPQPLASTSMPSASITAGTTPNMVVCPNCGTSNYDFVTRCSKCELQLIQICPVCEKLNSGQAHICEFCGSPLERPRGWSGVHGTVRVASDAQAQAADAGVRRHSMPPVTAAGGRTTVPPASYVRASSGGPAVRSGSAVAERASYQGVSPKDGYSFRYRVLIALERVLTVIVLLIIAVLIGSVIAALVSPGMNAAILQIVHLNVREALSSFVAVIQALLDHLHPR